MVFPSDHVFTSRALVTYQFSSYSVLWNDSITYECNFPEIHPVTIGYRWWTLLLQKTSNSTKGKFYKNFKVKVTLTKRKFISNIMLLFFFLQNFIFQNTYFKIAAINVVVFGGVLTNFVTVIWLHQIEMLFLVFVWPQIILSVTL